MLTPSADSSRDLRASLLLVLAVLAVYSGAWNNGFLANWDDPQYVTANPLVQAVTLENLRAIFCQFYFGTYAPVQLLSYMFDYALWGPSPRAFLMVNVVLHAFNAGLCYRLFRRLQLTAGWALLAALLFAVHPVQVESVAWIAQRKSVLAMAFFLMSFWQYLDYADAGERRCRHYCLSLGFFLLALLTKSTTVILPAVLVAYDLLRREHGKNIAALAVEKLPFLLLALGGAVIAVISQHPDYGGGRASGILGGSAAAAAMTMLTVYQMYLVNLFWPLQLSAEYHVEIKRTLDAGVLAAAALLALSVVPLLLARRRNWRGAAFWLAVFFIGFIPVSQIVPFIHPMNDRYLYFPMLGFCAGIALGLRAVVERLRLPAQLVRCAALVLLICLAVASWQRTRVWASAMTLWQDAVEKQPAAALAREALGHAHELSGDYQTALAHYRQALALGGTGYETYFKIGSAHLLLQEFPEAEQSLRQALELKPDYGKGLYNLGYVLLLTGRPAAAAEHFERGLRLEPNSPDLLVFLGAARYCLGELPAAVQAYEAARRNDREGSFRAMSTAMLSLIALRQGDTATSRRLWQEAVATGVEGGEIYLNWARLEALAGHRDEALAFLGEAIAHGAVEPAALEIDPTLANLRNDARFLGMVKR